MKTFKEFLAEAINREFHSSKESLRRSHGGELPAGHRAGYRAGKGWFASSIDDEKASKKRREERKNPLTRSDFHDYAKRNLFKKPEEFADIAIDREEHNIKRKEALRGRRTKKLGVPYHLDHLQPLSQERRKREHKQRRYAIAPGHSAQNLEVKSAKSNIEKGDELPKKGEKGSNLTRSGAIRHTANDTKKFIKNLDSAIGNVQGSPAKRMAGAYDRLTGLSPENPKPKKQTSDSSTPRRRIPPPRKIGSRNVPPPRKIENN
jgi:hypothetical protein